MATFVWAAAVAGNWSVGGNWKVGGVAQASPPTAADDVLFGSGTGPTNSNCNVTASSVCRSVDSTGYTGTIQGAADLSVGDGSGGAFTVGATTGFGGTWTISFVATSDNSGAGWNIAINNAAALRGVVSWNGVGGRWKLTTALSSGNNNTNLTNGTLDDNGQAVTVNRFTLNAGTALLSGSWAITATAAATIFNVAGGTLSAATATVAYTVATTNTRSVNLGGGTLGTFTYTVAGSTGQLTVAGSSTIGTLNFSDVTNARTLSFTVGTTTTITNSFNVNGTAAKLMTINSTSAGTPATIVKVGNLVSCDFLSVKDSTASGVVPFYAGANSTLVSGTTNWVAAVPPTPLAPKAVVAFVTMQKSTVF